MGYTCLRWELWFWPGCDYNSQGEGGDQPGECVLSTPGDAGSLHWPSHETRLRYPGSWVENGFIFLQSEKARQYTCEHVFNRLLISTVSQASGEVLGGLQNRCLSSSMA